ncbi:hypothetical protein MTO96_024078 [Rhipicephalus appendiculatus]
MTRRPRLTPSSRIVRHRHRPMCVEVVALDIPCHARSRQHFLLYVCSQNRTNPTLLTPDIPISFESQPLLSPQHCPLSPTCCDPGGQRVSVLQKCRKEQVS